MSISRQDNPKTSSDSFLDYFTKNIRLGRCGLWFLFRNRQYLALHNVDAKKISEWWTGNDFEGNGYDVTKMLGKNH